MNLTLDEITAMGGALESHVGKGDYILVALGARGPNQDMLEGNVVATVRMGDDEVTSEAKYLHDAITIARGSILRTRKAKAEEAARKKAKAAAT